MVTTSLSLVINESIATITAIMIIQIIVIIRDAILVPSVVQLIDKLVVQPIAFVHTDHNRL